MAPTTRATTSRVAKDKAQQRLRRLVDGANEVTFPRLDNAEDMETIDETRISSRVGDYRVVRLEAEVGRVSSEVTSINAKLDRLVQAACPDPVPISYSTPPTRAHTQRGRVALDDTLSCDLLPPPRQLRREANYDGYVDRMARADRFAPPVANGKNLDINEQPMRKPYMYIQRESCQTVKQKLEVRCELSQLEYTNALVKLVIDNRAYDPHDHPHIMRHLRDVTHDAMERQWSAVRKWSQHIFDLVENGDIVWADYQEIQNERLRVAYTAERSGEATNRTGQAPSEFICREYNTRAGCRHRGDHTEGNIKVLHACAFCDALYKRCTHSVLACDRKLQYASARQGQQPQRPQQSQAQLNWRAPFDQQQFNHPPPQLSKNGFQAPRQF